MTQNSHIKIITKDWVEKAEQQIYNEQKSVGYDTREFTIEIMVQKYKTGIEEDKNDIFVPDYQRDFVWDEIRQSKFIESIILGLPIPLIFVAETSEGRLEIVDGSQRIRTLTIFLDNELKLVKLEILTNLNGFDFNNLSPSRQKKFKNTPLRMIVLTEEATEDVRNDIFERINRGGDILKDMEKRKGIYRGYFTKFIYDVCSENKTFIKMTPVANLLEKRQEHQELVLRYFALLDKYQSFPFKGGVAKFLDKYLQDQNKFLESLSEDKRNQYLNEKQLRFDTMVNFVKDHFRYGFSKYGKNPQVSRIFFEAISVGVSLVLERKSDLSPNPDKIIHWINSTEFRNIVSAAKETHKPERIKQRIEYVRDELSGESL